MKRLVTETLRAGASQLATLVFGVISVKLLAITAGPAGVGLFSLFRQLQQTLTTGASLGGQTAIVQSMTSAETDSVCAEYRLTSFWVVLVSSFIVVLMTILFADSLVQAVLPGLPVTVIYWLMIPVFFGAMLVFFRGVLNSKMLISGVSWVNVSSGAVAAALAYPAGVAYAEGNVVALVIVLVGSLGIGAVVAVAFAYSLGALDGFLTSLLKAPKVTVVYNYLSVAAPSMAAALVALGGVLFVRVIIARNHGISEAGYFDVAWSISLMSVSLFFASLQTYMLPDLSSGKMDDCLDDKLNNGLRLSLIVLLPLVTLLVLIKPLVIQILFSEDFIEALDILRWTLVGDYLRIAAGVLAIFLRARAEMRAYFFIEVLWSFLFVSLSVWLIQKGIQWVGFAYIAAYFVYLMLLVRRIASHGGISISANVIGLWGRGLVVVVIASMLTWSDREVVWWKVSLFFVALFFVWRLITDKDDATKKAV